MSISLPQKKRIAFGGLALVLVAVAAALGTLLFTHVELGSASHVQSSPAHSVNQYASKFLCGDIASPASATASVLAPGTYNTAVNIHNPNDFSVTIQKKGVISVPESQPPPALNQGLPSGRTTEVLQADASMEVDCAEIINILNNSNPPASPGCSTVIPGTPLFCKGYLVVEAARIYQPVVPGPFFGVPAQLDVTDILTVKEEDGYWKDYTFNLRCLLPVCATFNDVVTGVTYGYVNQPALPFNLPLGPYNLPVRPDVYAYPTRNCYAKMGQPCEIYDVDEVIRQSLVTACGAPCAPFLQLNQAPYQMAVELISDNMATDSRDVSLDFEFVTPKTVRYNCWPKGNAACP